MKKQFENCRFQKSKFILENASTCHNALRVLIYQTRWKPQLVCPILNRGWKLKRGNQIKKFSGYESKIVVFWQWSCKLNLFNQAVFISDFG
jgi:hypothetical protein